MTFPLSASAVKRAAGALEFMLRRGNLVAAYAATLLYLEIIYIMTVILFLWGKAASIIAAVILTIAYSAQLIGVYFKNNFNRTLQLLIMELHSAYSAAFIFNYLYQDTPLNYLSLAIILARSVLLAVEIFLIFLLTSEKVAATYR